VGLDCAAQPERFGVSVARYESGGIIDWTDAWQGSRGEAIARSLSDRLADLISPNDDLLVALDSPLGWPAALAGELVDHVAGGPILHDADRLFRRRTDEVVQQRLGRRPLEIGADRIARAAVEALHVLNELREYTGRALPLPRRREHYTAPARDCAGNTPGASAAIEVYPAALLGVLHLPTRTYKRREARDLRLVILDGLHELDYCPPHAGIRATCLERPDVLDAVLCVLSGVEFLLGRVIGPDDDVDVEREGWAWVPDPDITRP
jgi:hypothetical protein